MKTLKISFLMIVTSAMLFACTKNKIEGSGNIVNETRDLSSFENILIKSVVKTNVSYGTDLSVTVRTDAVAVSKVITYVSNNTLVVDLDEHYNYQHITFEVDVVMPHIDRIEHRGVTDSKLTGFNGLTDLDVIHDGVGDLRLYGSATHLSIDHDGVGEVKAFGFAAETCNAHLSGVGNMELTVSDLLEGVLSGVGNIFYQGSPSVSVMDTGVGSVIQID